MRTSNPYLRDETVRKLSRTETSVDARMTVNGTLNKVALLLLVVVACATFTWNLVAKGAGMSGSAGPWMIIGSIGALGMSLAISFRPNLAPILAVPFAIAEGLLLGAISAIYQFSSYPNIVLHAVLLTIGVALSMFLLWRTGLVPITDRFKSVVMSCMAAIFLVYMVSFVLGFFGVTIPMIHSNGIVGIGFSVVVLIVVSMMLMVDFDNIEKLSKANVPQAMEWYGAFALLVTLVWLYLELLRLLSKLNRR